MIFCEKESPEITSNFPFNMASYPSLATCLALAKFLKTAVLSMPEVAPKPVLVAPGIRVVTVMLVSYNSSAKAFPKEVT